MNVAEARGLRCGDRLTHVKSGTPAVVEEIAVSSDKRAWAVVRFGGNPRTDPWGPFEEMPRRSDEQARDLERIVIEPGQFDDWRLLATP